MSSPQTLLATGFVSDQPEEGTNFPSAGGNSADPRVQAVYWRCIVALFASARMNNPAQRLALFTNVAPPVVDEVDIGAVLSRYGVELHTVPLAARLAPGVTGSWGNVLYFNDIMEYVASREAPDLRLAILDSDVLVTGPLAPLFALLDDHAFAGYVEAATRPDEMVNGLTLREMDAVARAFGDPGDDPVLHYGGELFLTSVAAWQEHRALFGAMLRDAKAGSGAGRGIITEEHVFSIAFALMKGQVASANHLIKRMWTSLRYATVVPGDERLLLWHLPAEKRYGLRDMFAYLQGAGFPLSHDAEQFRRLAGRLCGIPRRSPRKFVRDLAMKLREKLLGGL